MLLEFCHNKGLNFGDDLNEWLWPKLIPECLHPDDGWVFLGIGTVLTERRNSRILQRARGVAVLSSGSWSDGTCPLPDERWHVYGVRGPETARRMGLPPEKVVGDGAYLLANYFPAVAESRRQGVGFIPHHRSEDYMDWKKVCELAGVRFISARQPVDDFVAQVSGCSSVISEAMHGAIAADVMRVPWRAVSYAPNFQEQKWLDWGASVGVHPQFHALPQVYNSMVSYGRGFENRVKRALAATGVKSRKWSVLPVSRRSASIDDVHRLAGALSGVKKAPVQLSSDTAHRRVVNRLSEAVLELKKDFQSGFFAIKSGM